MRYAQTLLAFSLLMVLIFAANRFVFAQSPEQYYGGPGGDITGFVIGVNHYPVDWAQIYARNVNVTFEAFSGMSGMYRMRVPAGNYVVSVYVLGYDANNLDANVTVGSMVRLDFQLQQTQTPVPEFPLTAFATAIALALTVLILSRRK